MSKTYRKGVRYIEHWENEFFHWNWKHYSTQNNTVRVGGKKLRTYNILGKDCWDNLRGAARNRTIVQVQDKDNWSKIPVKGAKKDCRRIDRRRWKNAFRKDYDAYIKSSFDPWNYS